MSDASVVGKVPDGGTDRDNQDSNLKIPLKNPQNRPTRRLRHRLLPKTRSKTAVTAASLKIIIPRNHCTGSRKRSGGDYRGRRGRGRGVGSSRWFVTSAGFIEHVSGTFLLRDCTHPSAKISIFIEKTSVTWSVKGRRAPADICPGEAGRYPWAVVGGVGFSVGERRRCGRAGSVDGESGGWPGTADSPPLSLL